MPIIHQKKLINGAEFAVWHIEESLDELILLSRTPDERRIAVEHFPHERRKLEYVTTRLLIEHLTNTDAEVSYLESGKPILMSNSHQISLSHTVGYVAAIIHPTKTVGIDIETISPRILKIKEKFLSIGELVTIDSTNEITHLLLCWSAKETAYKVLGEEYVDFKMHMRIESFTPQTEGAFSLRETKTPVEKALSISYLVTNHFVLTWTV